jgi:hypothetical protein
MSRGLRLLSGFPLSALIVALAVAAFAVPATAATSAITTLEKGTLKACLYPGFAPFAEKKKDGSWDGWDVTYLSGFAKANGLRLEIVEVPLFDGIWLEPGKGRCDVAGTSISDLKERRDATGGAGGTGVWSNTYYAVVRTFLVRTADFTRLTGAASLKGRQAIVTRGSTAHSDLCYRLHWAGLHVCRAAGGPSCAAFPGLDLKAFPETDRRTDPSCVEIAYPRNDEEKNAAHDVAGAPAGGNPFTYGGGYGSIQTLVCDSGQTLATVWPHCNATVGKKEYAEPFSFVTRAADTGLANALDCYIKSNAYSGTPIPDPGCASPPWTTHSACRE